MSAGLHPADRLNHLTRDSGIPLDSIGSADALASAAFSARTVVDGSGPTAAIAGATFTSDAQQYIIPFMARASAQPANVTIELTTDDRTGLAWLRVAG
jgi:hypothetical protein